MYHANQKAIRNLCITAITGVWLVSTGVQAQTAMPMGTGASAPMAGMHKSMMGSPDMKTSMKAGMDSMQRMQMSGDTDKDFAVMMKMHHQQALDMAEMELAHGKSAELKAMAKNIIEGQKKEIAQFDRWLANRK